MAMLLTAVLLLGVVLFFKTIISPLARNIQIARESGLRYVVVPWFNYNTLTSMFMSRTVLRILNKLLPDPSTASWRRLVTSTWPLKLKHAAFKALGTDTFLTVAPGGLILNTANADVISQILARGNDFPKAVKIYRLVSIYGENVVSTDGATWRYHRKLTKPAFSEENNRLVWRETLNLSQAMLASWVGTRKSSETVHHVARDTMRLSLEVIGRAGLGQAMAWPKSSEDELESETLKEGHTMSFATALEHISQNVIQVAATLTAFPEWFLRSCPFSSWRKSYEAYENWGRYMEEIVAAKKLDIQSATPHENSSTDLVTQLCKGYDEQNERKSGKKISLTNSEVFGNLFVFIVAGHETTASSLHMTILFLAMHPETQKELQKELSEILQGRPPSEWDYNRVLPSLQNGFLGAVWNEELRLVSPVLTIPKVVSSTPQEIMIDGRQTMLPANLIIRLCLPSVQVNPKFWPHGPSTNHSKPVYPLDNPSNDLEEFKPRRWLKTEHDLPTSSPPTFDFPQSPTSESPFQTVPEAANHLFTPIKGSFLPFSEGHRSCLGRRFAQVEILAALAVVFSQYSVELAVDQWASDEEVSAMTKDQKRTTWKKASEDARWKWQNRMVSIISVQMGGGARVPLRIVRQGEERFFGL